MKEVSLQEGYAGEAMIPATGMQFLTFSVGGQDYGVDIMLVREVKGWTETTRLPNTPGYMRGVLNLRGIILPVFDVAARLSGAPTLANEKNVIVILAAGEHMLGLLVDSVSDIIAAQADDIKAPPGTAAAEKYISGLFGIDGRMVVLLDIARLLEDDLQPVGIYA